MLMKLKQNRMVQTTLNFEIFNNNNNNKTNKQTKQTSKNKQ